MDYISHLRQEYRHGTLEESLLPEDPFPLFESWFQEATAHVDILEPNAMALSTLSPEGNLHSRMVLLKGYDRNGFRFFTNSTSRKGKEILVHTQVALLFFWPALERQIHISGKATMLPRSETAAYFKSRPRGSQLGAWASFQSQPLSSRAPLEERLSELTKRFEAQEIPLPEFWNGYCVNPSSIEFWQGRPNRLHDRIYYEYQATKSNQAEKRAATWSFTRLNP